MHQSRRVDEGEAEFNSGISAQVRACACARHREIRDARLGISEMIEAMHTGGSTRRTRILALQSARRSRLRRIDYYPDEATAAIVDKLRAPRIGGDASSILNRIVAEWAAATSLQ
jgi:hypothetical protein